MTEPAILHLKPVLMVSSVWVEVEVIVKNKKMRVGGGSGLNTREFGVICA